MKIFYENQLVSGNHANIKRKYSLIRQEIEVSVIVNSNWDIPKALERSTHRLLEEWENFGEQN